MPRQRSAKDRHRPLKVLNSTSQNILQSHKKPTPQTSASGDSSGADLAGDIENVQPLLDEPIETKPGPSNLVNLSSSAAALHNELDSFRQRWRRELETKKIDSDAKQGHDEDANENQHDDRPKRPSCSSRDFHSVASNSSDDPEEIYALAKKLFLMGVELEQDDMHNESIRYYKQAMHLCPDIEKQIFREQCEVSAKMNTIGRAGVEGEPVKENVLPEEEKSPLLDRIKQAFYDDQSNGSSGYCRPAYKSKMATKHISDLPHDLLIQIFRYVIGSELDLASLESMGMVCRGFYILSHDALLWRSICYSSWTEEALAEICENKKNGVQVDWKKIYLEKPRVNCDGVYISRTKYIRQGDVGFQDITYRPFHVVRYYRHALRAKQFSSELSILDGTYKLTANDEVIITAQKEFANEHYQTQQQTYNQRRQARFHWSRQTPLWQKFDLRFKLKSLESRPFRNNTLKWLEYSILTRTELGQELTEFDITPDTFPSMAFSRVKRFNLRLNEPLASH